MAYDPTDPADKAIVDKLVKDAVDAALVTAGEEHETEIEGLKNKNKELLGKISRLRAGNDDGGNDAEISRLETELEETKGKLRTAERDAREAKRERDAAVGERDTAKATAETEATFATNLVIENGLTAALTEHKIAPQFMPAAVALLKGQVTVKAGEDGKRQAFVGDKPLGEFVKEWAASDAGKHYATAPANGGGGAGGGSQGGGSEKKIADMTEMERTALHNQIGAAAFDARVTSERDAAKQT